MVDMPMRCRCGHMRGVASAVSPSAGFRFVCYCKDCQAFARFLERPDILDAGGGTDIFQLPPSQVTFIAGLDALRCVRVSDKVLRAGSLTVAAPRSLTPPPARVSRSSRSFIRSSIARRTSRPAMHYSARRCAGFMSTPPSGRCGRTRRRHRFAFLPTVQ